MLVHPTSRPGPSGGALRVPPPDSDPFATPPPRFDRVLEVGEQLVNHLEVDPLELDQVSDQARRPTADQVLRAPVARAVGGCSVVGVPVGGAPFGSHTQTSAQNVGSTGGGRTVRSARESDVHRGGQERPTGEPPSGLRESSGRPACGQGSGAPLGGGRAAGPEAPGCPPEAPRGLVVLADALPNLEGLEAPEAVATLRAFMAGAR